MTTTSHKKAHRPPDDHPWRGPSFKRAQRRAALREARKTADNPQPADTTAQEKPR